MFAGAKTKYEMAETVSSFFGMRSISTPNVFSLSEVAFAVAHSQARLCCQKDYARHSHQRCMCGGCVETLMDVMSSGGSLDFFSLVASAVHAPLYLPWRLLARHYPNLAH